MHQIALGRGKDDTGWVGGGYIAGENHEMIIYRQQIIYKDANKKI